MMYQDLVRGSLLQGIIKSAHAVPNKWFGQEARFFAQGFRAPVRVGQPPSIWKRDSATREIILAICMP